MIDPARRRPTSRSRITRGSKVSLANFAARKLILVIYPLDFSPVCTDQLSIYQEVLPQIERSGATMVGISVDSTWAHRAFREKLGITIPLLSDFEPKGEVIKSYGAYLEQVGHGNRSLVLVDQDGVVRWVHESPSRSRSPAPT